jgi:hypothetical protein
MTEPPGRAATDSVAVDLLVTSVVWGWYAPLDWPGRVAGIVDYRLERRE